MLQCLLVDDDPAASLLLTTLVEDNPELQLAGALATAEEALRFLRSHPVDLLLLDIELPDFSGFELLQTLATPVQVIVISSKSEYAVRSFDLHVSDFLLKPVTKPRFLQAVHRVLEDRARQQPKADDALKSVFIRQERQYIRVEVAAIQWLEADGNTVKVHTREKEYLVTTPLRELENLLPQESFQRVHRSFVLNLRAIDLLQPGMAVVGNKVVPVSKSSMPVLEKRLRMID